MVKRSFNYAIRYIGLKGNYYKRIVSQIHEPSEAFPAATTYNKAQSHLHSELQVGEDA